MALPFPNGDGPRCDGEHDISDRRKISISLLFCTERVPQQLDKVLDSGQRLTGEPPFYGSLQLKLTSAFTPLTRT